MNNCERLQARVYKLEEENHALTVQKQALEKIFQKYQLLMGNIEHALSNWRSIKKMFEETCEEKGIQLAMNTELEFNLTGQEAVPMTYTMVIAQIETLSGIQKEI